MRIPRPDPIGAANGIPEGIIRTIVLMWTLRFLFFCGVAPGRLHRWYYPPMAAAEPEPCRAAPAGRPPR